MPSDLVDRDTEHLRLLAIFHYASAGVAALFGSFPLIHVAMGAFFVFMPESMRGTGKDAFPREIGFLFMALGLAFVSVGWGLAAGHFFTARSLKQRRRYWFCIVVCAFSCIACTFSSGIVGIASLVVLLRPGVKDLFESGAGIETGAGT
jgi:ABC-type uncharacterized transport system permease subunit